MNCKYKENSLKEGFSKRIVLAGNPNSGKTTLFNALCKERQHIGNWAGVTVESKTGKLFADKSVSVVDLPGIYSLSPLSPDEKVAGDYLKNNKADLIINIVDSTNLIRNLFLTTQLLEGHKNLLIALNMQDELKQKGFYADTDELEKIFRCKCISISAANGEGVDKLIRYILKGNYKKGVNYDFSASQKEEEAYLRYAFIKKVVEKCVLPLNPIKSADFAKTSKTNPVLSPSQKENITAGNTSFDKTSPFSSLRQYKGEFKGAADTAPLFAAPLTAESLPYKQGLSVSGNKSAPSTMLSHPLPPTKSPCFNCAKCGGSYPYYIEEKQEKKGKPFYPDISSNEKRKQEKTPYLNSAQGKENFNAPNQMRTPAYPSYCAKKAQRANPLSRSDKIDRVVTNKWLSFPIFILVISALFFLSVEGLGGFLTKLLKDTLSPFVIQSAKTALSFLPPWLCALLCDGALNGMFSVISFLPQIILLFGLISCLEASGYMARVVFITDRILSKVGLSGRSIIPFVTACGCAVPAVMSARAIKNVREHHAAVMLCPLMPCSAKTALFAFFTAAIFHGKTVVALSMYFLALLAAVTAAFLLKITDRKKINSNDAFIIELPPYRAPRIKNVLKDMWDKGKSFLVKAGTVIFLASAIMSFLGSFDWKLTYCAAENSILADIGRFIAPVFKPLGFGQWQFSVAALSGFAAKETVVSTLQILYANAPLGSFISPEGAYSFMAFNLLCAPCVAAVASSFKELGKAVLGLKALLLQTVLAYSCSFLIYQGAMLAKKNKTVFLTILCLTIALTLLLILIKNSPALSLKKKSPQNIKTNAP